MIRTPAKIKRKMANLNINDGFAPIVLATFMMAVAAIITKLLGLHMLVIIPIAAAAYFTSLEFSGWNVLKKFRSIFRKK